MLIRFGVSNFRSINAYQELLLTASKLKGGTTDLIHTAQNKEDLLPSVVIYGANASGKSNFLQALEFFVTFILGSHTSKNLKDITRDVFLLDPDMQDEVSAFDADFIAAGVRYHYGFKINNHEVVEEWLYAYPHQKRQVWFHRNVLEDEPFYFGQQLKGKNKTIASMTQKNSLFLSFSAHHDHPQLLSVYSFFQEKIQFFLSDRKIEEPMLANTLHNNLELQKSIALFLKRAGTGIVDVDIQAECVMFRHQNQEKQTPISFQQESQGTQYLITIFLLMQRALMVGGLLVIDEINASMHPNLTKELVKIFDIKQHNPKQAQLLYSAHDSNLLSMKSLRRDQVWYIRKDRMVHQLSIL